jgi:exonuclease VII small subunit
LEADKILKSARERMKPLLKETSTRTQSEESLEADKILKRARERMKLLMKETELAVS